MFHRMFFFSLGAMFGYCCKVKKDKKKGKTDSD